jgi:hypothetical protein
MTVKEFLVRRPEFATATAALFSAQFRLAQAILR